MDIDSLLADLDSPNLDDRDGALVKLEKATREIEMPEAAREPILWMMENEENWDIRLHIVRVLPRLSWGGEEYGRVLEYLFGQANGRNRFIQAWSLDSLAAFAAKDPSLEARVIPLLLSAMENGSAAVKVRARNGLAKIGRDAK